MNNLRNRSTIILAVILTSCYLLFPTYEYYSNYIHLSKEEQNLYSSEEQKELKTKALSLGLDLTGGIKITLESNTPMLLKQLSLKSSKGYPEKLKNAINEAKGAARLSKNTTFFDEFDKVIEKRKLQLKEYYKDYTESTSNKDILEELINQKNYSIETAINIMKIRINSTGLGDPNIQRLGDDRVVVEMAGVTDLQRIKGLIKSTGSMEFLLLLDKNINLHNKNDIDDLIKNIDEESNNSFSKYIIQEDTQNNSRVIDFLVLIDKINSVKEILNNPKVQQIILDKRIRLIRSDGSTHKIAGQFVWGHDILIDKAGQQYKKLYYAKSTSEISGGQLKSSQANTGSLDRVGYSSKYVIDMKLTKDGTKQWRKSTGYYKGSRIAIVLDNEVRMAPFIQNQIPNGETEISGFSTFAEAKDIANVLAAGEMIPLKIIQSHKIGPSLGKDSIEAGKKSMIIGFILVVLFMVMYYKGAGLIASCAMLLNLLIVIAVLAMFGWVDENLMVTLTLPGIAGLILTIGMTVDANVIVFERIKEELNLNKTIKSAIQSGYERALVTIVDANFTTLIAAIVLAGIGSGPIKGFAITLGIGILCSMFTAIFVTKTIFLSFPNFNFIELKIKKRSD